MPKPKWTTKEQEDWLSVRLKDFVAAQEKKPATMAHFFGPVYKAWFEKFPCPDPTDKEVAKAEGKFDVAKANVEKATKTVSERHALMLPIIEHNFTTSVFIIGCSITRAQRPLELAQRIYCG